MGRFDLGKPGDDRAAGRLADHHLARLGSEQLGDQHAHGAELAVLARAVERWRDLEGESFLGGDGGEFLSRRDPPEDGLGPLLRLLGALLGLPGGDDSLAHARDRFGFGPGDGVDPENYISAGFGFGQRAFLTLERCEGELEEGAIARQTVHRLAIGRASLAVDRFDLDRLEVELAGRLFEAGAAGKGVLEAVGEIRDALEREVTGKVLAKLLAHLLKGPDPLVLGSRDPENMPTQRTLDRIGDLSILEREGGIGEFGQQIRALDPTQ